MIRSAILAAMLAILCAIQPTISHAQQTPAEQMHMLCLTMSDIDERIDACTAAINAPGLSKSLQSDAYAIRGVMHFRRGDFAESRADIESALAADPSKHQSESVEILNTIDRIEKSVAALSPKQAVDACTHWRDPQHRLEACDQLVKSLDSATDQLPMVLVLRGSVRVMLGHFDDGMADIDKAIQLQPDNTALKERKADALWRIGRYDQAKALMDQLVASGSDPNQWANAFVAFAYLKGQLEEAAKIAESMQDALPNSSLPAFLAALIRAEELPQSSTAFSAIRTFPSDGPFAATVLAYRQGHASEQQVLDSANALPVSSRRGAMCQAHFNIAHRLALAGERAKAGDEFRQSVVDCERGSLEYVLSNAWLQRLG